MGKQIVYCQGCGTNLREEDFAKGRAHTFENSPYCTTCKPKPAGPPSARLLPQKAEALTPLPDPPTRSSKSGLGLPTDPSRPSTTRKSATGRFPETQVPPGTRRAPAEPSSSAGLVIGIVVGAIAFIALLALVLSGGDKSRPSVTPDPPRPAPAFVPPPPPSRPSPSTPRKDPAFEALEELRRVAAGTSDPEAILTKCDKVRGAIQGSDFDSEFRKIERQAQEKKAQRELQKPATLDKFLETIRRTIERDPSGGNREEVFSMMAAAHKVAGSRAAEVDEMREEYRRRIGETDPRTRWEDWKTASGTEEGSPKRLEEHGGRKNVLMTHPLNRTTPSSLERDADLPAGKKTTLCFSVAPHAKGDWELRVIVDGKPVEKRVVGPPGSGWKDIRVDLSSAAGRRVKVRLENAPTGWENEFGFWAALEFKSE